MKNAVFAILLALSAAPAQEVSIGSHELPMLVGTYGRYQQNSAIFMWQPFDSTRGFWDLTSYPGSQWARVGLRPAAEGRPPAPDSMATDPPAPEVVEMDTLGNGTNQWIYLNKDSFGLYTDGLDFTQATYRFIGNYQPDAPVYVTPVYRGAGWISATTWQYEIIPGVPYQATEQHTKRVVAKGKVRVPMSGEYFWPCLVIRDNMTFSDNLGTNDRRWIYEWLVPGHFSGANGVAAAMSQNGASSDFINVETMMKLASCAIPGWDLIPPAFADTRVWTDTTFSGPFAVWSTITDNVALGAESLFWRVNTGAWQTVGPDSSVGGRVHFTIPQVTGTARVDYFVWAKDSFSVANSIDFWTTWPVCSPESTMVTFTAGGTAVAETDPLAAPAMVTATPNPFGSSTIFLLQNREARSAEVRIYSMSGERVRTLEMAPVAGSGCRAAWDGANEDGKSVPAGTYLYIVAAPGVTEAGKVTVTR